MSDVSSILGFEPNEFISELNKRIDTIIVSYVDRFKQEVKRLITNKGQNKVILISIYINNYIHNTYTLIGF